MNADDDATIEQIAAQLDRGWDLVSRGDLSSAQVCAEKSLELDEDSPEALNLLGYIYAARGEPELALDTYRRAIDADEGFLEAMLNAAEVLIEGLGDYEEAIQVLDDALAVAETDDEVADASLLKIDALLRDGKAELANTLAKELPLGPFDSPQVAHSVGRAKLDAGDLEGAAPLIEEAVARDRTNPDACYSLGIVLDAKGRLREATAAFLESREIERRQPPPPWSSPVASFERRVKTAIRALPSQLSDALDGAIVVVDEMPGAEVVAEGVDPRIPLLVSDVEREEGEARVGFLFIYQRNIERIVRDEKALDDDLPRLLEEELMRSLREAEEADPTPARPN
jgi:tetratricopeptide (TPR) repeat protein